MRRAAERFEQHRKGAVSGCAWFATCLPSGRPRLYTAASEGFLRDELHNVERKIVTEGIPRLPSKRAPNALQDRGRCIMDEPQVPDLCLCRVGNSSPVLR